LVRVASSAIVISLGILWFQMQRTGVIGNRLLIVALMV